MYGSNGTSFFLNMANKDLFFCIINFNHSCYWEVRQRNKVGTPHVFHTRRYRWTCPPHCLRYDDGFHYLILHLSQSYHPHDCLPHILQCRLSLRPSLLEIVIVRLVFINSIKILKRLVRQIVSLIHLLRTSVLVSLHDVF